MWFREKDYEIPQVCFELGFEDRSYRKERAARMYNSLFDLTLWVNEPGGDKRRYVLLEGEDLILGKVDTDFALRELVDSVRRREFHLLH